MKTFVAVCVCVLFLTSGVLRSDSPRELERERDEFQWQVDRERHRLNLRMAEIQVRFIAIWCEFYKQKFGLYPEKLEQLLRPPAGEPYLTVGDLFDPWNKEIQYDPKGKHSTGSFRPDVWTTSPCGRTVANWPEPKKMDKS